ncbi:hypothetical protein [Haloferula sp. BvORR071]|uniref:glycosyl-4,4'-diaponeurosporenoate acyltransferase CrtO family protein n=1 Tax=Haloferula sp. BvORR071 TaxID=1396141 RepID=UPI002240F28E|nr:hypothetical protein [Haloferula sp. BvORR071]
MLQLGIAWVFTRLPAAWFERAPRNGNSLPRFYERALLIKRWKDLVPDGASWFSGGFGKAALTEGSSWNYLRRFRAETIRGESCHWTALLFIPVFFLWNPVWADWVMAGAFAVANLPCIAIQRYNRGRIDRLLGKAVRAAR